MLTIRREQLAVLAQVRWDGFRQRLRAHLRAALDAEQLTLCDADLDARLDAGLALGRRCFDSQRDLARLLTLLLVKPGGWRGGALPAEALQLLQPRALEGPARLDNFERWRAQHAIDHDGH